MIKHLEINARMEFRKKTIVNSLYFKYTFLYRNHQISAEDQIFNFDPYVPHRTPYPKYKFYKYFS